jgi:hypothetical protein
MKWVLAPLDEAVPTDIRQNLTLLREDLVDEGKSAKAAAPTIAYSAAWQLCQALLTALDERDRARVVGAAARSERQPSRKHQRSSRGGGSSHRWASAS